MKKLAAVAALVLTFGVVTAVPAQAHYDPWNTHWHYSNGQRTYKMCGWWDATFGGCKNESLTGQIVIR